MNPGAEAEQLFELPPELAIDTAIARTVIRQFIRSQLEQAGFERAVIGLSGGIDSALVAFLVADAIGAEKLLAVLMPYRTSSEASVADARSVVERLGCASALVDISPMVDGYFGVPGPDGGTVTAGAATPGAANPGAAVRAAATPGPATPATAIPGAAITAAATPRPPILGAAGEEGLQASSLRRGNFMARMRMAVLYDRSVSWRGLVVGTGNKTETLIGYTTLFGDAACAFNPIGDLYKSQVRQMAVAMGVPEAIIRKAPSADLWPGQTDESEAGFSYPQLDRILFWMIDKRRSDDDLAAMGFDPATVRRVQRMVATSEFKRQMPPVAKLGPRTTGVDYLYPRRRPGSSAS